LGTRSFEQIGGVMTMMTEADFKPVFGEPVRLPASAATPRVRALNRSQLLMRYVDIERLIPDDHPAKAIWELVGTLDLSAFYEKVKAVEGRAGQAGFDPRLLIGIWLYGTSRGINSARELSERCEWGARIAMALRHGIGKLSQLEHVPCEPWSGVEKTVHRVIGGVERARLGEDGTIDRRRHADPSQLQ
jgi:hypothetical protein